MKSIKAEAATATKVNRATTISGLFALPLNDLCQGICNNGINTTCLNGNVPLPSSQNEGKPSLGFHFNYATDQGVNKLKNKPTSSTKIKNILITPTKYSVLILFTRIGISFYQLLSKDLC
jgi:hypothetical protein